MVLLVLLKKDGTMNVSVKSISFIVWKNVFVCFFKGIKGTTGIFAGLKYRGKLFGLISNGDES